MDVDVLLNGNYFGLCPYIIPSIASYSLHSCPREADLCLSEDIAADVFRLIAWHGHCQVVVVLYAQFLDVSQVYLCALLDAIECSDTFLVPLVCSGCATPVDSGKELCIREGWCMCIV